MKKQTFFDFKVQIDMNEMQFQIVYRRQSAKTIRFYFFRTTRPNLLSKTEHSVLNFSNFSNGVATKQ